MEKGETIGKKPDKLLVPEFITPTHSCTSSYGSSGLSSSSQFRRNYRSKSLSNICPENYTAGDIRRIRERLLRTNSHLEPAAFKKFTRKQKLTLMSLALMDFMSFCSMSIMAPFFPREAAEKGMSQTMSGFVFSFYALIVFLTSPIFGKILPRVGAKFMFMCGMFTAAACNLLFGMLEYIQDYTLFTSFCILIRGLEALGASAFSTASYVFVANAFPNNIGSVLGILETFVGLGMSTGPAIGGILYSLGGFSLPFLVLGVTMILMVPIQLYLLPAVEDINMGSKSLSVFRLIKVPAVAMTSLIVIVVSSTWAFLDPTLEPHLRQFNLTPEKIGLIFLLFSGLYGISSPGWGWLADKVDNHWSMMIVGLFCSGFGLLLLGPCPLITVLKSSLWLDLIALSILGISVALALLPTFQSVLTSALQDGFPESIATYSIVGGIWSCMYSLGEVIGPFLGGCLLEHYGFPITSSIMAAMTFTLAIIGSIYFLCRPVPYREVYSPTESLIDSWDESSASASLTDERTPLIIPVDHPDHTLYSSDGFYTPCQSRTENEISYDHNRYMGIVSTTPGGACEV